MIESKSYYMMKDPVTKKDLYNRTMPKRYHAYECTKNSSGSYLNATNEALKKKNA